MGLVYPDRVFEDIAYPASSPINKTYHFYSCTINSINKTEIKRERGKTKQNTQTIKQKRKEDKSQSQRPHGQKNKQANKQTKTKETTFSGFSCLMIRCDPLV